VYDPFSIFSDPAQPGFIPIGPAKSPIQPLNKEEENSLLQQVTGGALSGLGYVGGVMDKTFGGRALRGALGGKPRELLSIIPGSDTLGITNEQDRVSGEDLAKQAGILEGEGEKGTFELRDILGPAIEAGLDPATYLTFGGSALTKAGQVAKRIGALKNVSGGAARAATTLGDVLAASPHLAPAATRAAEAVGTPLNALQGMKLGGHVGVGLPFSAPLATFDMSTPLAAAGWVGNKALGMVPGGHFVADALPAVGRHARALFDKSVRGTITPELQSGASAATAAEEAANAASRVKLLGIARSLQEGGELLPHTPDVLRSALEGTFVGPLQPRTAGAVDDLRSLLGNMVPAEQAMGGDIVSRGNYAPRFETPLAQETKGFGPQRSPVGVFHPSQMGRQDIFEGILGETGGLNQLSIDPAISGPARTLKSPSGLNEAGYIREKYLGITPADDARMWQLSNARNAGTISPADEQVLEELLGRYKQSTKLADYAAGLDPLRAEQGLPLFANDLFRDVLTRAERHNRFMANADEMHNILAKAATADLNAAGPGAMRLPEVLKSAGLANDAGALTTAGDRLQQLGKISGQLTPQDFLVPGNIAKDVTRYVQGFAQPEATKGLLGLFDSLTGLTKAFQTAPWPGFHTRNLVSGAAQNLVSGLNPGEIAAGLRDANTLARGGVVAGAAELFPGLKLTDEQATKRIADLAFAHRAAGEGFHQAADQGSGQIAKSFLAGVPGEEAFPGILPTIASAVPKSLAEANPLNLARVAPGLNKDVFAPVVAGRAMGQHVEDLNRLGGFIGKLRQGFSPEAAAAEVRAAHVDYSGLSEFERKVMRRAIPFYTFASRNAPYQIGKMLEQPGGFAGQMMRLTGDLRDQSGFVPPYLGNGLTIPVGQEDETGKQRFLTGLGLPHEQAFENIKMGPKGAEDTLMSLMGQMNPLIKAPLEFATGKQFYSGRDLADLHSPTGSTFTEQLLMNSPLGRLYTTGKTLMDDRKGIGAQALNLGTGIHVSDVDLEKARNVAARELLDDTMRGNPAVRSFTQMYVPPDQIPLLTPEQFMMMRLNRTLEKDAQEAAKKKKRPHF
jgi:hypothetical protein